MIISYEMFLRSVEEVRNIKFGLVICDEAHRLKNTAIKTATVSCVPTQFPVYLERGLQLNVIEPVTHPAVRSELDCLQSVFLSIRIRFGRD